MTELTLGQKIRVRRKEKRLTLAVLSELSGVDKSYLGRIENGQRSASAHTLRKLASPLGYGEVEILKLGGYLSPDRTDERIARFKEEIKNDIRTAVSNLITKIDAL